MAHEKGTVYFMVSYLDDDSLVPVMETVVYLGQELPENAAPRHMFQAFESWKEPGAYPNNEERPGKGVAKLHAPAAGAIATHVASATSRH